jgi:hypothetical protein
MREVSAEGTRFYYFGQAEDPGVGVGLELQVEPPASAVMEKIAKSEDVRPALFVSMLNPNRGHIYFLHWCNGQDLDDLDQRVEKGEYSDADFSQSIKTVYQDTWCDKCNRSWPTLVVPPGDPYPGAPGLMERKIASRNFARCPCGAPFRQMVVKIFTG